MLPRFPDPNTSRRPQVRRKYLFLFRNSAFARSAEGGNWQKFPEKFPVHGNSRLRRVRRRLPAPPSSLGSSTKRLFLAIKARVARASAGAAVSLRPLFRGG